MPTSDHPHLETLLCEWWLSSCSQRVNWESSWYISVTCRVEDKTLLNITLCWLPVYLQILWYWFPDRRYVNLTTKFIFIGNKNVPYICRSCLYFQYFIKIVCVHTYTFNYIPYIFFLLCCSLASLIRNDCSQRLCMSRICLQFGNWCIVCFVLIWQFFIYCICRRTRRLGV